MKRNTSSREDIATSPDDDGTDRVDASAVSLKSALAAEKAEDGARKSRSSRFENHPLGKGIT